MAVDGSLIFDTKVDTKGFESGKKTIQKSANSLKSSITKLGAAIGVAFGVKQLVAFSAQAVETASDLQEVQNVVDTAFGDMAYKMEEFADKAVETYGISKLTAKQTGSTFMAMAKGMGLATSASSDMSIALTGLSADMASFYNVEQSIASTALKSIFTGETETLKQFGVVMTETNLQEFARQQGITKTISKMNQAEKVQLRYNYVMKQTALAQGDFAKTSDGWANQTRILSERWKEFKATIGNALMAGLLPVIQRINSAMSALISYATQASNALMKLFGIENKTGNTEKSIAKSTALTADNYSDIAESSESTAEANDSTLASFDEINQISDSDAAAKGSEISPSEMFEDASIDIDTSFLDRIKNKLEPLISSLKKLWKVLEPFNSTVGAGLKWLWENALKPLGNWVLNKALPLSLDVLSHTVELLTSVLKTFKPFGEWMWDNFLLPIIRFSGKALIFFLETLSSLLKKLSGFEPLLVGIAAALGTLGGFKWLSGLGAIASIGAALAGMKTTIAALIISFTIAGGGLKGFFTIIKNGIPILAKSFKSFMGGLSPMKKIGITIAAVAAVFATTFTTINKFEKGTISLKKAIANLVLVIAPVGIALYAMLGPVGLAITAVAALAGVVAGSTKALEENINAVYKSTVYNQMGVPISEYSATVTNLADTIRNETEDIISLGDSIEENNTTIDSNAVTLDGLMGRIKATGEVSEETAQKISDATSKISSAAQENI
ncbi:MAG: hypothetical protein ACI4JX_06525, partial [Oscillospiraceae bacterium]